MLTHDKAQLLKVLDCLIDTAKNTTELDTVYNDKTGKSVTWDAVRTARTLLRNSF